MSGSLGPIMGGAGVDSSIPLAAGRGAQVNPLASVGDFARALGAINNTKLQQQQLQSGTMSLWQQQKQLAYAQIAPLVAQGRINNVADLTSALAGVEAKGGVTAPFLQDMVNSLGQGGDFVSNLKAQTVAGTQPPEKAVAALAPAQSTVNQGLVDQPMLTGAAGMPNQGVRTPVGEPAKLGAPPGVQGSQVTWKDPAGAEHYGTWSQYNQALGNGQVNGPPVIGGPGAGGFGASGGRYAPSATSPGIPALRNPAFAPVTPNPAAPTVATPGQPPSLAGPGAAQSTSMAQQGAQSATRFQAVADEATQAKEQDAVLANMQNDLQNFTSGPGAHNVAQLEKLMQGYIPGLNGAFKTKIAAQESFDKLANQLVTNASPGSDARQAVIQGATPNSAQSPEGVDFILRQLRGMTDYRLARGNLAATAPEAGQGNYPGFQAGPAGKLNPQVFQFARLTPAQQQTFLSGIPPGEQAAFKHQFIDAWRHGFYGVDNGMPPPPGQ